MSKFKNKKALALSVGAIMAGVSVIGVVAACAPTKAKPAKPTEKKVEQPQTGGNESSNPGSGSTTTGTKQGSETGGSTDSSGGSTTTTKPKENETKPTKQNGNTESMKDGEKPNLGSNPSNGSSNSGSNNSGSQNPNTQAKPEEGKKETTPKDGTEGGSQSDQPAQPQTPPASGKETDTGKQQDGTSSENGQNSNNGKTEQPPVDSGSTKPKDSEMKQDTEKGGGDSSKSDAGESTETKKMEDTPSSSAGNQGSGNGGTTDSLGGSTNDNNQKSEQEAQATLTAKKTQTKEKISKLAYLSEADKKSFNDQVDAIADPSKINEADEIVKQAELKNNEEKTKKEQADKQKEAEATLKTNKEEANNTINALANLTPEERKEFTDNVDKITDTTKSEEINKIVEEAKTKDTEKKNAKEAATKLEEEKQNAIAEINKLQALEESERAPFVQKIEAIKTVDQKEEIQKTLKEAKDANAKKVAAKAKKEAEEVKSSLTPVSIRIASDKYIWLKLKTTNQTFSKIEAKRLKFTLNNGKGGEFVENAAGFSRANNTIYYQNKKVESDGTVTFEISSEQKYGAENEKGTWKVTQVWLSDDTTETNLLTEQSGELTIS